jgi:hypothetical protein
VQQLDGLKLLPLADGNVKQAQQGPGQDWPHARA